MLSFPSALNVGGNGFSPIGKQVANAAASTQNVYTKTGKNTVYDTSRLTSLNVNLNSTTKGELAKYVSLPIQSSNFTPWYKIGKNDANGRDKFGNYSDVKSFPYYEVPWHVPAELLHAMNNYNWVYRTNALDYMGSEKDNQDFKYYISATVVSPSIFNPAFNVQRIGFTGNVPLLMNAQNTGGESENLTDCSIRELVRVSHIPKSILGNARYRYADFMYCKDLGKVSNNHLITLRKFAHPVGDNIFEIGNNEGDIGRLVAWFDTDDNKLESILNYNYHATWKELNSKIQSEESQEESEHRGVIGKLANTFSPKYNSYLSDGAGYGGYSFMHDAWKWLGTQTFVGKKISNSSIVNAFIGGTSSLGDPNRKTVLYTNYDNNKVYEPKDTVQSTHIYEGKLEFNNEISLVFSYKLRSYENINPKSAFLDLMGNILEVTYRRGKFWGGDRKIIGPSAQNNSAYQKAYNFVDNAFEKVGGVVQAFCLNGGDWGSLLGSLGNLTGFSDLAKGFWTGVKETAGQVVEGVQNYANQVMGGKSDSGNPSKSQTTPSQNQGVGKKVWNFWTAINEKYGIASTGKAMLKNKLGRPSLYAWDSLLSGDPVGLWHLTIGNPKNPIASMGNLIMTDATVTHSGPLGVDDFPTEVKVTIKLKHAKPRDLVDIAKMYTKGTSGIYIVPDKQKFSDFAETENYKDDSKSLDDIEDKQNKEEESKSSAKDSANKTTEQNNAKEDTKKTSSSEGKSQVIESGLSDAIDGVKIDKVYKASTNDYGGMPTILSWSDWMIEKYNDPNIFKNYVTHKN